MTLKDLQNLSKQKKQVLLLYSTTIVGVLLGVISSIVNTRFITPDIYGDVRYVQNILNFSSSLLLFGFFQSGSRLLAIAKDKEESSQIKGCLVIILMITALIQMAICFGCSVFNLEKDNISYLFLLSIPVCYSPLLLNYMNTTAQGDNQIGKLALARLIPALIYVPTAYVIYRFTGANASKMILLQWGCATIVLTIIIISTRPSFTKLKENWVKVKQENKVYGSQLYIGSLVMVATNYIAGITLGMFNSNNTEVGFYTLALTITTPLSTLPAIIGTTYFKRFATQPKIPSNVLKATLLLTISSCVLFILIIKPLVEILYPTTYASVGTYAIILSIGFSMHGFGDMINRYLGSHSQGKSIRNASIANGIFKIFGFTGLVYLFDIYGALSTIIICDAIYLAILLYYYKKFISQPVDI